jgi:hypothetical protein
MSVIDLQMAAERSNDERITIRQGMETGEPGDHHR